MRIVVTCLIILTITSRMVHAGGTLHLTNDPWPPYTSDELANGGIATHIVQKTLQQAGYDSKVSLVPWERALKGTMLGQYDILITASFSEERAKKVLYSEPYLENTITFLKLASSSYEYNTLKDIKGLKVGTIRGYLYSDEFDNATHFIKDDGATNIEANLQKLSLGRVDLIIGDTKTIDYYIDKKFDASDFSLLPKPVNSKPMHIIIRKNHPEAADIIQNFNAALER